MCILKNGYKELTPICRDMLHLLDKSALNFWDTSVTFYLSDNELAKPLQQNNPNIIGK